MSKVWEVWKTRAETAEAELAKKQDSLDAERRAHAETKRNLTELSARSDEIQQGLSRTIAHLEGEIRTLQVRAAKVVNLLQKDT